MIDTAIHIIKFIIKALLFILLLPLILVWLLIKLNRHKIVFKRQLIKAGVPIEIAAQLVKEIKITSNFI